MAGNAADIDTSSVAINRMPRTRYLTNSSENEPVAVWGRHINKSYGKLRVLKDLDITVPRGCIYGLLGPSGCGKTTLLRCVIGRLHMDSGHLVVLGDRQGSRGHKVPGSLVGYMPQETALFPDLTIAETLQYFGRLHGMDSDHIGARTDFLIDFLMLPDKSRLAGQLSGGQMRRVSFCVALLHEPELLILDEPTVGVDPLLRERIWDHLINITSHMGNHTTIILTTHYIEEARQAGKSLESVFLKLCEAVKVGTPPDLALPNNQVLLPYNQVLLLNSQVLLHNNQVLEPNNRILLPNNQSSLNDEETVPVRNGDNVPLLGSVFSKWACPVGLPSGRNIAAQFMKNLHIMRRKIGFLLFQFMLPFVEILLFCICIGNDPFGLHLAIVNEDTGGLGQRYLQALDNHSIIQVFFSSGYSAAYDSVRDGHTWAVIHLKANFTQDLIERFSSITNVSDSVINGSSVHLQIDSTSMATFEIMLAHMFTKMFIVVVQIAVLLSVALLIFKVPCLGPLIWVILPLFIRGFLGMSIGVLFSAVCCDENSAIQLALGSYFPLMLISGK
ncbi:ABC transporter G family member 20-like [Dreissena polymorpha]|uniref:ABC transporter G family member 20-like n=1 Tax=Dreissena polymorpha TaxID=45954 RepID=UPI00226443BA|nr:ABC transporter G family member 20-like [Dreissena polymorpha]